MMRAAALLVIATGLSAAGPVSAEQAGTIESFGRWRIAWSPRDRATIAWTQADGTIAAPDICRGFVEGTWPAKFPPAEAAALRRQRAACLVLSCAEGRGTWPRRYDLTLVLYGAIGLAEEHRRGLVLRGKITLILNDGPVALNVGLTTPVPVEEFAKPRLDLILFPVAALERTLVERILRSGSARVPAIRERFAAYIWAIPYTIGAYAFDLSGGAAALARLDERCR